MLNNTILGGQLEQVEKLITVLLVDDSAPVRSALAWRLGFEPDIEVVGQASRREEALPLALSLRPDVIVLDLHLQGKNHLSLPGELCRALPGSALVILSAEADPGFLRPFIDECAYTLVSKYQPPDVLLGAIRNAVARLA